MFLKRIIVGFVFLLIFLASVKVAWLGWVMPLIMVGSGLLGIFEFSHLARHKNIHSSYWLSFIMALLIFADAYWGGLNHLFPILGLSLCIVLTYYGLFAGIADSLARASVTCMAAVYVALPMGIALFLFRLNEPFPGIGLGILVFIVVVSWSTDTGAYFFGKNFGRHKLTPKLSPNKTVEGSIGGLLSSFIAAFLLILLWESLQLIIPWHHAVILAFLIGVFAQVGDLAESAFKRDAGVKDSGAFIVGHGGVLDVVDSLLFTIPMSYLYILYVIPLGN